MTGLLGDADVQGHVAVLIAACRGPKWRDLWDALAIRVWSFNDIGLTRASADAEVWAACQVHGLVLITGNRNAAGPDSLEVTIRTRGTPDSLPVLTLANRDRLARDRSYAEDVAGRLIEITMEIDRHRGTGRMYLP